MDDVELPAHLDGFARGLPVDVELVGREPIEERGKMLRAEIHDDVNIRVRRGSP